MAGVVELDLLRAAAADIASAPWGTGTAVADVWATRIGMSRATLFRKLKDLGIYDSGRKKRADAGQSSVSEAMALQAAGLVHLGTRAHGKRNMSIKRSAAVLAANGIGPVDADSGEIRAVSPSTLSRVMRSYRCHPDQLAAARPALAMRSEHPNHVWQVDSSVAVLFYAPGGGIGKIQILDDAEVYKNKPDAIARVQADLCIRWLVVDHCSGAYFVRYQAGHETALGYVDFMIEAMQCRNEPFHGVPSIVVMDRGSAARAAAARNFHARLGIRVIEHATKNSRAKGSVEGGHNWWENLFESRLFMHRPASVEELNSLADRVRAAHSSAEAHTRTGMPRWSKWLEISETELILAPAPDVLRDTVNSNEETRKVDGQLMISFATRSGGSHSYYLGSLPGVQAKDTVTVVMNAYRAPAIDVLLKDEAGETRAYTVAPAEKDRNGFYVHANTWGEAIRALPKTASERQLDRIHKAAYGVPTAAEVDAARKGRDAYADLDPWADFNAVEVPAYLPRRGKDLAVRGVSREAPPVPVVEAVKALKAAGDSNKDVYQRVTALFPGGEVPQAWLDGELAMLATPVVRDRRASA